MYADSKKVHPEQDQPSVAATALLVLEPALREDAVIQNQELLYVVALPSKIEPSPFPCTALDAAASTAHPLAQGCLVLQ